MKKINTKKIVLLSSLSYIIIFGIIFFVTKFCNSSWCRVHDDDPLGMFLLTFLFFIPIFILSLITHKMRDEVFHAWWSFARWWVPVIIFVTIFLNNVSTGGGTLGMDEIFSGLIYSVLYGILIVVSVIKIVRSYSRSTK